MFGLSLGHALHSWVGRDFLIKGEKEMIIQKEIQVYYRDVNGCFKTEAADSLQ